MWFRSDEDIDTLISKGKLSKAASLLRERLETEPDRTRLRQQLGDVLGRAGKTDEAVRVLAPLVHTYVDQGFTTKAIAVIKKIQRLDPYREGIARLIAKVERQHEEPAGREPRFIRAYMDPVDEPNPLAPPTAEEMAFVQGPSNERSHPADVPNGQVPNEHAPNGHVPESTSKLDADWFDKARARNDFNWSPILSPLSIHQRVATVGQLKLIQKHAGAIVYGQGEPARSLFVLATGFARAFERWDDGSYRQVMLIEEGQFFGEEAFFQPEGGRKTTVTAARDCELLELDLDVLRSVLQEQHGVLDHLEGVYRSRPWALFQTA